MKPVRASKTASPNGFKGSRIRLTSFLPCPGHRRDEKSSLGFLAGSDPGMALLPSPGARRVALSAIRNLIQDPNFDNFPFVFDWLTQWLREHVSPALPQEVLDLLQVLAERSPAETTYFSRQLMRSLPPSNARRLIRAVLPMLPEDYRQRLQSALRQSTPPQKPPPSR